jgi:transposase
VGCWAKGMSHEIHADYAQMDLLPQSLEEWVPGDHPARFIREFVEALDLPALGFRERAGEEGRPAYANELLLKVWLYGYLARIRSTRDLERACREHLSLLWLTGRHALDHCTLWRFWDGNRKALRKVFRAAVKVAAEQGLVGMICHAVDGTKIAAVASRRGVEHREDLEKLLARVEAGIGETEAAIAAAEKTETGEYRLPANLQVAKELRAAIEASLKKMDEAERDHLHPQEGEARLMPCGGRNDPAYNAQAVADAQSGMIVAQTVVKEESDNAQLVPMLEETKANLGAVAAETLADGGYASAKQLGEAQEKGFEVLVSRGAETGGEKRGEYASSKFTYDAKADEVICPQGKRLEFEGLRKKSGEKAAGRSYRCRQFTECPVRELCSKSRKGRRIDISPQYAAMLKQREKRQDPAQQALLRRRKVIIEPVFGTMKQAMGFRRWTVRGLEKVQTQWALLCTAYNLKKIYRHWATRNALAPA